MRFGNVPLTFLTAVSCVIGMQSAAHADDNSRTFLQGAIQDDRFAIKASTLALSRTTDPSVKALAELLIIDYTQLLDTAVTTARKDRFSVPLAVTAQEQLDLNALKPIKGNQFDRAYTSLVVSHGYTDTHHYQGEVGSGRTANVKVLAANAIAVLKAHLADAITTQETIATTDTSGFSSSSSSSSLSSSSSSSVSTSSSSSVSSTSSSSSSSSTSTSSSSSSSV